MNHFSSLACKLLSKIEGDYNLAKKDKHKHFYSAHWNVFEESKFNKLLNLPQLWEKFLRNSISIGFNDSMVSISNKRFATDNNNYWNDLKSNYSDILEKFPSDLKTQKSISVITEFLLKTCGLQYLIKNKMSDVGDPQVFQMNIKQNEETTIVSMNLHDLGEIYYKYEIENSFKNLPQQNNLICEIGGGYGGMATKIKKNYKNLKYIIFDLPEVNAVQTYYLNKEFPDAKIYGYKDFLNNKKIINENFDFLILPGWTIKELRDNSVDMFINMRSIQEMNLKTIDFYFKELQRTIKIDGIFTCINRYKKESASGECINFTDYPYDTNWNILKSKRSILQDQIHILISKRDKNTNNEIINKKIFSMNNYNAEN